jgi:hypothetical protein
MNLYWTGAFSSIKFNHHSQPITHVHIRRFAMLCWIHVTDWSTESPGKAGQCNQPVRMARNSTQRHI